MNHPPTPDTPERDGLSEYDESDRQFFERLADRKAQVVDPQVAAEADALRSAFERESVRESTRLAERDATDPQHEERLLERILGEARQEGLRHNVAYPSFWARLRGAGSAVQPRWGAVGALSFALLVGVGLVRLWVPIEDGGPNGEPMVTRGAFAEQVLQDPRPRRRAEQLQKSMVGLGIDARIFKREAVFFVTYDLAPDELAARREELEAMGLKPALGANRVQIDPK